MPFARLLALIPLLVLVADARADDGYARALRKGRKLEAKGDHAGALKAYGEALAARPGDAAVLSEVSVSALAAGDLARAREAATRAAKSDAGPRLVSAAYYNLGQIEEKARDVDKAVAAYRSAMASCPSTAARGRLAKLAPKVARELDGVEAEAPDGPYPTLEKAAAALKCEPGTDEEAVKPRPPFLAARNLICGEHLGFALQLKSGWYAVTNGKDLDGAAENTGSFELTHDWPGLGPVLEWTGRAHHHHVSHSSTAAEIEGYGSATLVACVVAKGEPLCLSPLDVAGHEYEMTNDEDGTTTSRKETEWSIEVKYADRAVEISGSGECTLLPGRHALVLDRGADTP